MMWGRMRTRGGGHRVSKMDTGKNYQSQKWKIKVETRKELGFGMVNGGTKYHGCGWGVT